MTKPILRILLIDDDEDDYVTFRDLLSDCQEFSDHLSQIFTQGFTTKQNGMGYVFLVLHWLPRPWRASLRFIMRVRTKIRPLQWNFPSHP